MRCFFTYVLCIASLLGLQAQEKEIYIPKDLQGMDLKSDTAPWSMKRTAKSKNFVVFWERGFGDNPSEAPDLEGHNMKFDVQKILNRLESFYAYYCDSLHFLQPGSKAERYRMMAMVNYSLESTAYGGDYDGEIGALWVSPNRIQDDKLNCLAHELGHSFQSQISCDGKAGEGHLGGFHEMTSQWMLWQVNPDWITDENYHWEAFMNRTYKTLFDEDNIYHSPYVLEYWGWRHGKDVIAKLYRNVGRDEDPGQTYMRVAGLNSDQFADEMFDCYRRLVTYDMPRIKTVAAPYANRWKVVSRDLGNYGFNVERIALPRRGHRVSVVLNADLQRAPHDVAQWMYGFVGIQEDGTVMYGPMSKGQGGKLTWNWKKGTKMQQMWLVVMGAPKSYAKGGGIYPYTLKGMR